MKMNIQSNQQRVENVDEQRDNKRQQNPLTSIQNNNNNENKKQEQKWMQQQYENEQKLKNMNILNQNKYTTFQRYDETSQMRKKQTIGFIQNELKTQLMYQQLDSCSLLENKNNNNNNVNNKLQQQNQSYDLPIFFQSILENLKLIYYRTRGQIMNIKKISDFKIDLARADITRVDKYYIFTVYNIAQCKNIKNKNISKEIDEINKKLQYNDSNIDLIVCNKHLYNLLSENELKSLAVDIYEKQNNNINLNGNNNYDGGSSNVGGSNVGEYNNNNNNSESSLQLSQQQQQNSQQIENSTMILDILSILEINKCFYNDQYFSKVYSFHTCLNRMLQGDFNFIELLYTEENTPLTVHPCILATRLYFEDRLADVKGENQKKIYQKPFNLPNIVFINLDGFDHPINLAIIKKYTTFHYFSIFSEFFHPDGPFSFYHYLKSNQFILKQFFPFFLPFFAHVQQYYENKCKKNGFNEEETEEKLKEKLEGLYKGVISDEEFAFIFEEYIFSRIHDLSKIDLVIVSYSCVMSPFNERTNHIFQFSEELFFNIFTHLARRTNFRMIFVPRLIINTYKNISDIPSTQTKIYPGQSTQNLFFDIEQDKDQIKSKDKKNKNNDEQDNNNNSIWNNKFNQYKQELNQYEKRIREVFGINQIIERINNEKITYKFENLELIKYVQNITCGFFSYFNSLNNISEKSNKSIFTDKNNLLHWRFVNSIVYMQNRLHSIKNQEDSTNNNIIKKQIGLGQVKKEYRYFIEVLKEKENQKIQSYSDQTSLEYKREIHKTLEYTDSIFLFQIDCKKGDIFENELSQDNLNVKKYKIVNTMNKICYMTKYSQHYVDYKNGIVYFFNILFPSVDRIQNNLMSSISNCIGYIPKGRDNKDNEIQVFKISDWKFTSQNFIDSQEYSSGFISSSNKDNNKIFFLQESTIIPCSLNIKDNKYKFLLFFGGKINYFDKNTNEINLDISQNISNTCLYALKIGEKNYKNDFIYNFNEILIEGVEKEFLKNLSYSSGAGITFGEKEINIYGNNKFIDNKYIFIFGGQYESDKGDCSLQNIILYSYLTDTLLQISQSSNIPISNQEQPQQYSVNFIQVPKQNLIHLDSIKSMNMRKALNLKQKNGKKSLDSKILLIGGTNSKFLNYSDQNKLEVAHFFYPCLYLNCIQQANQANLPLSKIDIKPEHGFIQRIELHQQFSPQQIASMNHNYIVKCQTVEQIQLEINDPKKISPDGSLLKYYLEQMHVEIRIIDQQILHQKKDIYIKSQDNIADEQKNEFQFKQTFMHNYQSQQMNKDNLINSQNSNKNKNKSNNSNDNIQQESKQKEEYYIKRLQSTPAIYANQEENINGKEMVQLASQLNLNTINDFTQKRAEHVQILSDKIHVDKNQRFQGCFFSSFSMILEAINCKKQNTYQDNRIKPKPKANFWENMKHYNKKQQGNLTQQQQQQDGEISTMVSLPYESIQSSIIFHQSHIKSLMPNGITYLSNYAMYCQTAHQNQTDLSLHIYWKQGSSKLLLYDDLTHQFIQLQMLILTDKKFSIVPEIGQICQVFYNQKDQHIYIYVEEEWKYNYKNVIMRAPISQINYQQQTILFIDDLCQENVAFNKITFTINSNDKIFGILQEKNLFLDDLSPDSSDNNIYNLNQSSNKLILIQNKHINCSWIIEQFETFLKAEEKLNINILETYCDFGYLKTKSNILMQIPFYLAILGKQVQYHKLKDQHGKYKKSEIEIQEILKEIVKEQKENVNDSDQSKFKCISIQSESNRNENLIETIINILCEPNVRSLIHSSFCALILNDILIDGSAFTKLAAEKEYKITYLDLTGMTVKNENVYYGFIDFFSKKGSLLKYLNISSHKHLLHKLIINSQIKEESIQLNPNSQSQSQIQNQQQNIQQQRIKFDSLIYFDISECELLNKQVFMDYLQYLLNTSFHLQGININKLWENGTNDLLLTFDDLQNHNFSSLYASDYDLHVYIEKGLSSNLQENDDQLIMTLKQIIGDNIINIKGKRDYQKLKIKSKNATQITQYNDKIDKLYYNYGTFQDPIVFSIDIRYLIFERINFLKQDKEKYVMHFYNILQSECQKSDLQKIKSQEIITISFKEEVFSRFDILNISKSLNDEREMFVLFGIMHDFNYRAYIAMIVLPVPTSTDIQYDQIKIFSTKANIKKYSQKWRNDCYLPISHNKKVQNIYLCLKDAYQQDGYSFFQPDQLIYPKN